MADGDIKLSPNPNVDKAFVEKDGKNLRVVLQETPSGTLELSDSPNVDTGYVIDDDGKKHRVHLVAEPTGTLELPDGPASDKGYIIDGDGKKHRVSLVANVGGGSPVPTDKYALLDRVKDDTNTDIGIVVGFHIDADNKKYAIVCLNAQYRLASGQYLTGASTIPTVPSYSNVEVYEAKETATFNCDKAVAFGNNGNALTYTRAEKFTIDGVEYAAQIPSLMELLKCMSFRSIVNAGDPTADANPTLVLATNITYLSSTQITSSLWNIGGNGRTNYATKTATNFVAPILEIPMD